MERNARFEVKEEARLMIGETVSHYRIVDRLGSGGMGVVYEAEDLNLGRRVALKFLPEELAKNPEALERFQREARAASALNHPHICTIHDLGEHEGKPFLVMELLEGHTLQTRIEERALSLQQAAELGSQMADALAAAHDKGIVHRDLKPSNLFVTARGDLKILDFGLAKLWTDKDEADSAMPTERADEMLTTPGTTMGTVAYMSPEQARGEPLDARTDLFSSGVVLYQMATGCLPFDGGTSAVIFSEILGKNPTPATQINPAISPGLQEVLTKALEKDRNLRYQSAADMRADLQRLIRDSGTQSVPAIPAATPGKSRKAGYLWGALTILVLILVGSVFLLRKQEENPPPPVHQDPAGPTIAILPFQNLGADTSADYLRLAVPDEITTVLSRVPSLTVRPFSSSASYSEAPTDLGATGRELRAANLVTGQYYTQGTQLSLTLEAINVEDNRVVWRDSITVPEGDLLSLRGQVAERVRLGLLPELGLSSESAAAGTQPTSADAYKLYARSLAARNDLESNKQALKMLERSAELDPNYAPTWASLALRYYYDGQYADGGASAFAKGREAAQRAITLDPNLIGPAVYFVVRGADDGDLEGAFETVQTLVEHRPDSAAALFARSYVYRYAGLLDESSRDCEAALALDPIDRGLRSCANAFTLGGRIERARDFLALDPGSEYSVLLEAGILIIEEKEPEAIVELEGLADRVQWPDLIELLSTCHEDSPGAQASAVAYEARGRTLDPESVYFSASHLAYCGHSEAALRLLRQAIDQGFCSYPGVDNDPRWDGLRRDPDFQEIHEEAIACRDRFVQYLQQRG